MEEKRKVRGNRKREEDFLCTLDRVTSRKEEKEKMGETEGH